MRYFILLFLNLMVFCTTYGADVNYKFSIKQSEDQESYLDISLNFIGNKTGETVILLPSEWADHNDYYKNIYNIKSEGVKISNGPKAYIKILNHEPNKEVTVTYQIKQPFKGAPTSHSQDYLPILQPNYFHFIGHGVFIYPDWLQTQKSNVSLTWDLPKDWKIINSYGLDYKVQELRNISWEDLSHALYLGGDYRISKVKLKTGDVYIALRDKGQFKDKEFVNKVSQIIKSHRQFWGDEKHQPFLVSALPIGNSSGMGGTGLKNTFALFLSPTKKLNKELEWLVSHEYFHTWNSPTLFKSFSSSIDEAKAYWFTEGFTDYYANLALLRAKLFNLEDYVRQYNETLLNYYLIPKRNISNVESAKRFWQDHQIQKLLYYKGNILAHHWNAAIKKLSNGDKSFDDLMHHWVNSAKNEKLKPSDIALLAHGIIKYDFAADITNYMEKGKDLPINPNALGPCAKLEYKEEARIRMGFLWAESKAKGYITGTNPKGPGFKAGIRDGQKLISIIHDGNYKTPITVVIEENGAKKTITYQAYHDEEKKVVPQFIIDKQLLKKNPQLCYSWFER